MTTSNDDLMKKIEDLRQEMDSINRSVTSLRYDGMTKAFREQIGASFLENNRNAFRKALKEGEDGLVTLPKQTFDRLCFLYDHAIALYELEDINGAMLQLEELGVLMELMIGSGPGADQLRMLLSAVNNTRQQMALMETLRSKVGRPMLRRSCESVFGGMEPEEVEGYLSPLSNAVRLKIMAMLFTSSRSFTEMTKELDMQKGHLQFHLKKLLEVGYIKVDPRTHLYSIEERAYLIMEGLSKLFSRVA